jgi:hypothetical protein
MMRKVLVSVGLMLVLSLGFATAASAAEIEGCGRLWARGIGYAEVHGNGAVDISVRGTGTILVKGAEVLRAEGQGRRWDLPGGGTLFAGWRGKVHVAGKDLNVKMWGGILDLEARGTGWVFLKGRGQYRVHGHSGFWTQEGIRVEMSPPESAE